MVIENRNISKQYIGHMTRDYYDTLYINVDINSYIQVYIMYFFLLICT